MKRLKRRQAQEWLAPVRKCFDQMLSGEVDSIRGYAVTSLGRDDTYDRIDYCIAGFRGLIGRLLPEIDTGPLRIIEAKLANGVPLTHQEIYNGKRVLNECEDGLTGMPVSVIQDAVITEQIRIELDQIEEGAGGTRFTTSQTQSRHP